MSGFTREILIKFETSEGEGVRFSEINKLFISCLKLFFKDKVIKPEIECLTDFFSIYFFLDDNNNYNDEKLYSFLLTNQNFADNKVKYLSIIDNSSDTSELFGNNLFFNFVSSYLNSFFKIIEAYLLCDPEYILISDIFERNNLNFIGKFDKNDNVNDKKDDEK